MEAFLSSTLAVAIAEIGDKTQLLTLFLAARFSQRHAIILGILVATLINHAVSAYVGNWVIQFVPPNVIPWAVGLSFIAVGLWVLIPDKDEDASSGALKYGAFVATCVLFFIAEIGDKTQIATIVLAAKYQAPLAVVAGSTLGLMLANVPVVYCGKWIMDRIPLYLARYGACALFCLLGALTLVYG
ncbi:TMEM165/GDT1 family protein [Neisseriaceae bacterium CLB008]|nr:TMEM165/GDT1 family protein [Neisseriaceae bacterium]